MKREQIKKSIRQEKRKKIEVSKDFYDKMAVYFLDRDMHAETVYKLIKVRNIDQMLMTMREQVVKEYKLHIPTIEKLSSEMKQEINRVMEAKGLKERLR